MRPLTTAEKGQNGGEKGMGITFFIPHKNICSIIVGLSEIFNRILHRFVKNL